MDHVTCSWPGEHLVLLVYLKLLSGDIWRFKNATVIREQAIQVYREAWKSKLTKILFPFCKKTFTVWVRKYAYTHKLEEHNILYK